MVQKFNLRDDVNKLSRLKPFENVINEKNSLVFILTVWCVFSVYVTGFRNLVGTRYDTTRHSMPRYGARWNNTLRCDTIHRDMMWCNATHCDAIECDGKCRNAEGRDRVWHIVRWHRNIQHDIIRHDVIGRDSIWCDTTQWKQYHLKY